MDEKLRNFISGLVAGWLSVTVCNPLDVTRTRLNIMNSPKYCGQNRKYTNFTHTMETIWQEEGIRGFYQGYRVNVVAVPVFHSLFFPIYQLCKYNFHENGYSQLMTSFYSTLIAGLTCNVLTNPIWVVRTRIMTEGMAEKPHYGHEYVGRVLKQMIRDEGIHSLFKGILASVLSVSNAIIYFITYEYLMGKLKNQQGQRNTIRAVFEASTISKALASSATYPLIVIRTILQENRSDSSKKGFSTLQIIKHIVQKHGIKGFYKGLKPDLIRLLPSNAILFMTYQCTKQFLAKDAKHLQ